MLQWPSSLRSRLTLSYSVLLLLPLILFAISCYVVVTRTLEHRTDRFISDALTAFSRELMAERRSTMTVVQAMRSTVEEVHFRDLQIVILDANGQAVARNATVSLDTGAARRTVDRPFVIEGQQFVLRGAYARRDIDAVLERIRQIFLVAIPLFVFLATLGGYLLAKRSLAPVASMAAHAARISATNLNERIPVQGGDELVRLARVVNSLLDRLEHAFAQQRQFVSDASHELRTPTAIVRTEADITLSRAHRSEGEYRASVTIMQDAAQRLTRIVDDLFLLSRADAGHLIARPEALYLEELVHNAARGVRSVADQRAVVIHVQDVVEAPFHGDVDLLGRLLLNLLDNAIKYSLSGGTVGVVMARTAAHYEISVVDAGPGIPADDHERVFERFYRVDSARSRSESSTTSGAGLGLAIARRIAELHGGQLDIVESRVGRTEFRLRLGIRG